MEILKDVNLYTYSTMRTNSIGAIMYIPENLDELKQALLCVDNNYYLLGAGSNVVFSSYVKKPIINLMRLNNELSFGSNGIIRVGCSVRIQKLINFGMEHCAGGIEYLYSLPASVGGVVFMNAGRGKIHHQQISDWIRSVCYLDLNDMVLKEMPINKNEWSYRCSPFQRMNAVIYSVDLVLNSCPKEQISTNIQDRINIVKINQEANKPSCGSVMHTCNKYIMYLFKGYRKGGAHFSNKTNNWITNDNNGTGDDVIKLIEAPLRIHRLFRLSCIPEIRIFR